MLSCHNEDCFATISLFIHALCYHQCFYWSLAQSFASNHLCDYIFEFGGPVSDEFIEFLSCVRVGVSHKKFIILEHGRKFKSKLIVHPFGVLSGYLTFFVGNFFALSPPASIVAEDIFVLGH